MKLKPKKLRVNRIKSKMGQIIDDINYVGESFPETFEEFVQNGIAKHGIYKLIENSIENIIQICSIINSDLDLGVPETEESILDHLEIKNIFSKKIISILKEMKKFRNILVHRYGEIDDEKAYETIKEGLKDFELFVDEVDKILKSN